MADHSANAGRHALADRKDDLYETPPEATRALLSVEKLPHWLWEPAAGRGAIVDVLRRAGHAVIAGDLVDYGLPLHRKGHDFLMERKAPVNCEAIITNPPYKLAAQFVEHGLDLVPRVYMLLRLAFLESVSRTPILDGGALARVYVFRNRLPMMHRDGWEGPRASSSIPFAWFCWHREHAGPTELRRISWESEYDGQKDLAGSIEEGLRAIRDRQAKGGPGWVLPESSTFQSVGSVVSRVVEKLEQQREPDERTS
jgi:hypothetical protein